jgi:hypothetical protein
MFGEKLHYEDMIRYELDASVENAACGSTSAVRAHLVVPPASAQGGKIEGVKSWKTVKYRDHAKKHQNLMGVLDELLQRAGNNPDKSRRINSTATCEWMALALSDDELKAWMQEVTTRHGAADPRPGRFPIEAARSAAQRTGC